MGDTDGETFIVKKINKKTLHRLTDYLIRHNAEEKPVTLYIDSRGGCPSIALAIAQLIREYPHGCDTVVLNRAFSAAVLVAAAGRKRYALKGAQFMFHPTHATYEGEKEDVEIQLQLNSSLDREFDKHLKEWTKLPSEIINTDKELYLLAEHLVAYGLVHEIGMPWIIVNDAIE